MHFLLSIWDAVRPHMAGIGLVVTWAGIALVAYRRRLQWRNKHFPTVVNFSLNYVADGKLQMRTLLETSASAVWLNEYGVKLVQQAAGKTKEDQPFILLQDPNDMRFVKRAALNVLSARFPEVFLGTVIGAPVHKSNFLYAVTYENYPDMRTRKFRILLVEEKSMEALFGPDVPELGVVEPSHRDRLRVLRLMYQMTKGPVPELKGVDILGKVELGVVA